MTDYKKDGTDVYGNDLTRHGHVFLPESRAYFAWQEGKLDTGALNQREAGKFFPRSQSGLKDVFASDDIVNNSPPSDGKIASAGQLTGQFLDTPGTAWRKHQVNAGELFQVSWAYSAIHLTRRWNYFFTRDGWDPQLPLSRAQFESEPFYTVQLNEQPFWSHNAALRPPQPTNHQFQLPNKSGYHVMLAVWEVADTGNAFYQVVDLDFV